MARVISDFPLSGTINGITFFRTKHGNFARAKNRITKDDFLKRASYAKIRENSNVFGQTAKHGMLIRTAFKGQLRYAKQSDTNNRLTKVIYSIMQTAKRNDGKERDILNGDISLLEGFEFNTARRLSTVLYTRYNVRVDRAEGLVTLALNRFIPESSVKAPKPATDFRLSVGVAELDFATGTVRRSDSMYEEFNLDDNRADNVDLQAAIYQNSPHVIVVTVGIEFFERFNQKTVVIKSAALAIVEVSRP